MRQLLEGRLGRDSLDRASTGDDVLEHLGLEAGGTGGAGKHVGDEEVEAVSAVGAVGVLHVVDDLGEEVGAVDRLGVETV